MAENEDSILVPSGLDDLRGLTPEELRNTLVVLDAHLRSMHQTDEGELRDLNEDEESALETGIEIRAAIVAKLNKHERVAAIFRDQPKAVQTAISNLRYGIDNEPGDVRRLTMPEARERALRILDSRDVAGHLSDHQKSAVERSVRRDTAWQSWQGKA